MKAAKRSILICVLTLILSVSLLAGVTFAWFTDSITNSGNTIQSGELAIDATAYDRVDAAETDGLAVTIGEGNVASGTYYFEAEGASLRNGDPVITEENWQPGDMNAKLFTVSNEGSIDAVVSLDFFVSGDLAEAMWYDFIAVDPANGTILGEFSQRNDLNTISDLADSYGEVTLEPEEQVTFLFVYGMSTDATSEYMNSSVDVKVVIAAKQNVEGAEGPVSADEVNSVVEAVQNAESNSTVVLSGSDYEVSQPVVIENKENIVIDGNGATIKASSAEGASIMSATSKRIATAADTQTDLANNIINVSGATNVTIRNLTIEGALHHGINIWECENVVLENVTITNSAAAGITINASDVTVTNIHTSGNAWGGINVDIGDNSADGTTIYTKLTVTDTSSTFDEYFPIYADSAEIADNIETELKSTWNVKWAEHNVYDHNGNARVVWTTDKNVADGDMFVNSSKSFSIAVQNKYNIFLLTDIVPITTDIYETVDYLPAYDRANSKSIYENNNYKPLGYGLNYSGTINLNGYTLDFPNASYPVIIGQDVLGWNSEEQGYNYGTEPNNVTIKNGKLDVAGLLVLDGATLTVEDVEYTSKLTSFGVQCKGSALNVVDSTVISTDAFVIGTNASEKGKDGTGTHGVIINVTGSTLKSDYIDADSGSVTVFFNVPGNLNIEDSKIYGVQNAVMVRGGTAVIKNSTLTTAEQIASDSVDKFTEENWGNGNEVPYAALLVGDRNNNAYNYSAFVTLVNTEIKSGNAEVPTVYIWQDDNMSASLIADYDTQIKSGISGESGISGKSADGSSVFVYLAAEGEAVVTSFDELKSALEKGGDVVLANEITVTEGATTLEVKSGDTLRIIGAGIININGTAELTIVNNGSIIQTMQSEVGYLFRASGNSKLTLNGDGEYVAGLTVGQAGDNSVITVNGGSFNALVGWSASEDIPETNWIFNLIDDSNATISVTAGTFVNYDPSNSQTENPAANFVAEGYKVIKTTGENETPIYTVVPEAQQ